MDKWKNYTIKYNNYRLEFSNGEWIEDFHVQDCCEHVYVDWKSADFLLYTETFNGEPKIEIVEDAGIRINGWFIPAYNEQDGYYSDELSLIFSYREDLDIKECTISR